MIKNKIFKKLVQVLGIEYKECITIFKLAKFEISLENVQKIIDREVECSYEILGIFLDAVILYKRGESTTKETNTTIELTFNLMLKKIRIALNLQEEETLNAFKKGGIEVSKSKLSYMLRSSDHRKYKNCSAAIVVALLDGLKETN